ncbi:WD40 repeat-like superfamily protein, putative [Babesia ovata]|uniref:WD40 repeat-like superfamily protein, putative n=1 Tax=Babesia ovata TaxID=189622 RepID=A0A2H6K8U2_9APIC|nr:WD40 repeat-like superfamily protein, putative [Babesia ovata]GBE59369.1 WD40 repeat-like superfamily protein, putative [Babesia ovata]
MWRNEPVIAVGDNAVLLLDAKGRVERELSKEGLRCTTNAVAAAANLVCVATSDKAKITFISESQSYKVSVPELITAVAFSRCGEVLYAGSNTGRLYVWQIRTGTLVKNKQIFFNAVTDAKVDFSNTTILLSAQNGDLALIRLVEGSVTGCVETLNLITCALDGVRVWDLEDRLCISHYSGIGPRINKLLSGVRLAEKAQFVPLKNVVSQDSLATIAMN